MTGIDELREALRAAAVEAEGARATGLSELASEAVGAPPLALVIADEHRDRGVVRAPEAIELVLPEPPGRDTGPWLRGLEGLLLRASWVVGVVEAGQLLSRREVDLLRAAFERAPGRALLVVAGLDEVGEEREALWRRAVRFAEGRARVLEPGELRLEPAGWAEGWSARARAALGAAAPTAEVAESRPGGPSAIPVEARVVGGVVQALCCPRLPWLEPLVVGMEIRPGHSPVGAIRERLGALLPAEVGAEVAFAIRLEDP